MNIKNLEYFKTICDCKSIAKAAKVLYLTPQGLSRIIKSIESEFETQLLIRTVSGIQLTETGQYLYEKIPEVLHSYESIRNEILSIERNKHHEIDLISAYGILRLVTPECEE